MWSRRTSDYSPLKKGSKEETRAINARKEMLATFADRTPGVSKKRKSWDERMALKARAFVTRA